MFERLLTNWQLPNTVQAWLDYDPTLLETYRHLLKAIHEKDEYDCLTVFSDPEEAWLHLAPWRTSSDNEYVQFIYILLTEHGYVYNKLCEGNNNLNYYQFLKKDATHD